MKLRPPLAQDAADEEHPGSEGSSHCVSQTRSLSVSGEAGDVVDMFATFIFTRRHAVPAGWHVDAFGQETDEPRMSRLGMFALVCPSASKVPSPGGSVTEFSWTGSPDGLFPLRTPFPPTWRTYIACDP